MIKTLAILALSLTLFAGCQTMPETPDQVAAQVMKAAETREKLWTALQKEQDKFTPEEWVALEEVHNQALGLAAQIEVGLSSGAYPPVTEVEEWVMVGKVIYDEAWLLLEPLTGHFSTASRSAWAMEKARLRALEASGNRYVANPNAATYREVARVGLGIIGHLL